MLLSEFVDKLFAGSTPSQVVTKTLAALFIIKLAKTILGPGDLITRANAAKWSAVRTVFAPIVAAQVKKAVEGIVFPRTAGEVVVDTLPPQGLQHTEIVALCEEFHNKLDLDYEKNNFSGVCYHGGKELTFLVNKVMEIYQWSNPLHFDTQGACRKLEAEIVAMVVKMYTGGATLDRDVCGALTSGGTESIGMAIKTYRDWGRATKGITNPSVVMPITAHPAFDKACHYYKVEIIKVPVGESCIVDPAEVVKYIKYNTVAIIGSAVTYPHGSFDPIAELAEIAYSRGIGLHVDCCLGSFIVPFLTKAGFPNIPVVDFRNRGVTSISCDTHKYGFAPKGTSVVMYGSRNLRQYHFFATADWPGGCYGSPGAAGSKPGNVIAGTWAAMVSFGEEGYRNSCLKIVNTRIIMSEGIKKLPGIIILGNPQASVFGFTSTKVDVYMIQDRLKTRGWALASLQFPAGIQFSVTFRQTYAGVAEKFVSDITEINADLIRENEALIAAGKQPVAIGAGGASMYGSQQRVADRTIVESVFKTMFQGYYDTK